MPQTNSDLDLLISYYEEEKQQLEALVQENVQEMEYKSAHRNSVALSRVRQQLETLYRLKDPHAAKRESVKRKINFLSERAAQLLYDIQQEKRESYLADIDAALDKLNQLGKPIFQDAQEIDDAVFELVEGKIKGFKIHLIPNKNFFLDFRLLSGLLLVLSFTPFIELDEDHRHLLSDYELKRLRPIGFGYSEDAQRLEYKLHLHPFRDAIRVKTVLARVVFDAYAFGNSNVATLERY